ncbi:beta-propeller fold lactonase family protein [Nonomuraea sp. NPDC049784]|uniref:lactonase family protein n=1 Tax=Nonomuraea sp. NPDC049784 TaxID=3154361 RepID=UPI0033F502A9
MNGAWFDPDDGIMAPFGIVAQVNSSWQAEHPSKPVRYVGSGDAGGTVSAFRIDRATGVLDLIGQVTTDSSGTPGGLSYIGGQSLSTDSPEYTGTKSAAELGMSRDGRFVYTSNRGENTIVVFAAGWRTGRLTLVQRIPCGGVSPWSFSIHRGSRWMLVANQVSSTVNPFSIDPRSGKLTDTGKSMPIPNPDCITFG